MRMELGHSGGCRVLNRVDLEFFYYCVCHELDDRLLKCVDWDTDIKPLLDKSNVTISFVSEDTVIADTYQRNIITMAHNETKECKAEALMRHLRNAFAHFRISHQGHYYLLHDMHDGRITMRGKIDVNLLKEIIYEIINKKVETFDSIVKI